MEKILQFLIEVQKLKEIPRRGLVVWRVKNPATIAEHTFRFSFSSWLLGQECNLNLERMIKLALFHDLCEVYAGDLTPLFYYYRKSKRMMRWFRLSKEEREKRTKKKMEIEKKSLLKLIKNLPTHLQEEIFSYWFDFTNRISKEAKFAKQVDRIETLLESIEYIGTDERITGKGWWEGTEEIVEDPLLLDLLKIIQDKFYKRKFKLEKKVKDKKLENKLKNILNFLLEIGKLRRMPRLYWTLRGVQNPETVAEHIFSLAIMAWTFGKERKDLSMEKLLKMALCHELSAVYAGDTTPYDRILPKDEKGRKKVLERMLRLSKKEKEWIFLVDYKKEKKALEKLIKKIPQKDEILILWEDYRKRISKEAKFLNQLNTLAVLLQGLIYEKREKDFSTIPLWEWAFESIDDEICLSLLDEMKKRFYG